MTNSKTQKSRRNFADTHCVAYKPQPTSWNYRNDNERHVWQRAYFNSQASDHDQRVSAANAAVDAHRK
jgi:hypothetical protein